MDCRVNRVRPIKTPIVINLSVQMNNEDKWSKQRLDTQGLKDNDVLEESNYYT